MGRTYSSFSVNVSMVAGSENEVEISGFYLADAKMKATVDFANLSFEIKSQVIYSDATNGSLSIVPVNATTGNIDRTAALKGSISADGVLSIDGYWGIVIDSGENKDKFIEVGRLTEIAKPNATMTYDVVNSQGSGTRKYPVYVKVAGENQIVVENFYNTGYPVTMELNYDKTAFIPCQPVMSVSNGESAVTFYTVGAVFDEDNKYLKYYEKIKTNKADNAKVIEWGDWTIVNSEITSYGGRFYNTKLTVDFDVPYPVLNVTDFKGDGTESNPYLISSIDDLKLLAAKVNGMEEANQSVRYSAFKDVYFKQTADIDMTDLNWRPIGGNAVSFDGHYDGGGKTIKNLYVKNSASFSGLFGIAGASSVIENLNLESPDVWGDKTFVGTIAGYSAGKISNCHVTDAKVSCMEYLCGGIAGGGATIVGCSVKGGQLQCLVGYAGGIVGEVSGQNLAAEVTDCEVETFHLLAYGGLINNAVAKVGGIAGSANTADVTRCSYTGVILGGREETLSPIQAGGVVGGLYNATVSECFSVAQIVGAGGAKSMVGGIVGNVAGNLENSYSAGNINCPTSSKVGGIAGSLQVYPNGVTTVQPIVRNCFTTCQTTARVFQYNPAEETRETIGGLEEGTVPVVENIYFDTRVTDFGSTKYRSSTEILTSAEGVEGIKGDKWTLTEGYYPRLKFAADSETAQLGASAPVFTGNSTLKRMESDVKYNLLGKTKIAIYGDEAGVKGNAVEIVEGNTIKVTPGVIGTDVLYVLNDAMSIPYEIKAVPVPFAGEGTEEKPFLLKTKEDMVNLSKMTTEQQQNYDDMYFKLANDIDMELTEDYLGICASGVNTNAFQGVLDGDGHTISRLKFDAMKDGGWTKAPTDTELGTYNATNCKKYLGVVGRLGAKGVVKNLSVAANSELTFFSLSGAIVGESLGTIENCRNYADIVSYLTSNGGIVGQTNVGSKVTGCLNAGSHISGNAMCGGVIGQHKGTVENCVNTGTVAGMVLTTNNKATSIYAQGGIVGRLYGGIIRNCLNAGTITGEKQVGGITGTLNSTSSGDGTNDVYSSVNIGSLKATNATEYGAIGGQKGTAGKIENNYWDSQILPIYANGGEDLKGCTGKLTSELTSGTLLEGLSADYWQMEAGKYPILKSFADDPDVKDIVEIVWNLPADLTAYDISRNVDLPAKEGLKFELTEGEDYKIEGNTLVVPTTNKSVVEGVLLFSSGKGNKTVFIKTFPGMPLKGAGTASDPYQISTPEDWANLIAYQQSTAADFEGKYLKVMADIDLKDTAVSPMNLTDADTFKGVLDGDGHKVSGMKLTPTATYQGVFGTIAAEGVVKNLTLGGEVTTTFANTGVFAGKLYGTLENCVNEVVISSDKLTLGGFVSNAYKGAKLAKCVNKGTVKYTLGTNSSAVNMGGLVGDCGGGVTFTDCCNEGVISYAGKGTNVGGLVGKCAPSTFENCYNTGKIEILVPASAKNIAGLIGSAVVAATADAECVAFDIYQCYNTADITGNSIVGGLVGAVASTLGKCKLSIDECYNTGNITATTAGKAAGIVAQYTPGSTISNCYNTGAIECTKGADAAGIAAIYNGNVTAAYPIDIMNCYNTGSVKALGNDGGGIVATMTMMTITNCYNTAEISGGYFFGGIAGQNKLKDAKIEKCWNAGDVLSTSNRIGGILGSCTTLSTTINDCWNMGDIKTSNVTEGATTTAGNGIGGIAGDFTGTVSNSHNTGSVEGMTFVAGIVGQTYKGTTYLTNCYNAGKITAKTAFGGALVGSVNKIQDKDVDRWSTANKAENCFYVSDMCDAEWPVVGTPKSLAELSKHDMGQGWTSADDYSLPVTSSFVNHDAALVNSAQVILSDGDTKDHVTQAFKVGAPEGVTWTATVAAVTFEGNDARVDKHQGEVILTATKGDYSKSETIKLDVSTSGVDSIEADAAELLYFTLDGNRVAKPAAGDGQVYIIVKVGKDGSKSSYKFFNK